MRGRGSASHLLRGCMFRIRWLKSCRESLSNEIPFGSKPESSGMTVAQAFTSVFGPDSSPFSFSSGNKSGPPSVEHCRRFSVRRTPNPLWDRRFAYWRGQRGTELSMFHGLGLGSREEAWPSALPRPRLAHQNIPSSFARHLLDVASALVVGHFAPLIMVERTPSRR